MTAREAELTTMLERLIWAVHRWGCDKGGIPLHAYPTFQAALDVARIPVSRTTEHGEMRYSLDPDWVRRMREDYDPR